jgi:hypothetical protein
MSSSRKRLSLHERRAPLETPIPLDELFIRFTHYLRAYGRSAKTVTHYQDTFKLLVRFLDETERPATSRSLTTETGISPRPVVKSEKRSSPMVGIRSATLAIRNCGSGSWLESRSTMIFNKTAPAIMK